MEKIKRRTETIQGCNYKYEQGQMILEMVEMPLLLKTETETI